MELDDGTPLVDQFKKLEATVNNVIDGSSVAKETVCLIAKFTYINEFFSA